MYYRSTCALLSAGINFDNKCVDDCKYAHCTKLSRGCVLMHVLVRYRI